MDPLIQTSSLFFELGTFLEQIILILGPFTYLIIFLIIFIETGFVLTYFLPGDSLVFLIGTLAGSGKLNIILSFIVILIAAILGDSLNYWIGRKIGPKVFKKENSRFFNKKYLKKTHDFFEKHGKKTIIISRFVPMLRTFAPFVAGIGSMNYRSFLIYNIIGAVIWTSTLLLLGFYLGTQPFIKENFEVFLLLVFFIFLAFFTIQFVKNKFQNNKKITSETSYEEVKEIFDKNETKKS